MRFRLIDRYLLREIVGPLALGFLIYTFILLIRFLFQSAEMIIRRGLPLSVVGELLVYTLPNIVVLTIPMSLLFGILIAVGRLASDSELVALRASGLSLLALYRPILLVSAFFALANVALMIWWLPWGNHSLQRLRLTILTETVAKQVEPRVFYGEFENVMLYVFEMPEGDERWHGVFLAQSLPSAKNQITVADRGRLRLDEAGERVVLELENAFTHEVDLNDPESYQVSHHERLEQVLEDEFATTQRGKISSSKGVRELTWDELLAWRDDPGRDPELRNLAAVELHKRFSIPFACIVFGLFALPLGFNNRRGGKGSGFALSLLVIALYYVMINNGEEAARFGKLPAWVGMWLPNLVLIVVGFLLLARRNRDKSLLLTRVDAWIRQDVWTHLRLLQRWRKERRRAWRERQAVRPRRERAAKADLVLRLPRPRLAFPNLNDRYVMRTFGFIFLMVLASGLTLYIIADLGEIVDEIIKNQVPRTVLLAYYQFMSLQIFYDLAPILVLVATLITFSLLARSNEVTAWKALGVSLFRLAVPAVAVALGIVLLSVYLQDEVLPASNVRVAELQDRIKNRESPRAYRRADRQWLFGQGRYVYNYLRYDPATESLARLQVFEFDEEHRLVGRLYSAEARFDDESGRWLFDDGWARRYDGSTVTEFVRFDQPRLVDYPETPEYFSSELKLPEQMDYGDLRRYIRELEASGQAVPELQVQLYSKISYPVISLVMALVALPFAFRLGRHGALYGIGLSIFLGIIFVGIYALFTALGETGALPPLVAVWSPNLLFGLFALYLFLGVRT